MDNFWRGLLFIVDFYLVIYIVFFDHKKPVNTLAWIVTIVFMPVVGIILYILFSDRRHFRKSRELKAKMVYDEKLYSLVNEQLHILDGQDILYNDQAMQNYHDIIRMNVKYGKSPYTQDNQVKIFTDGQSKYASLIEDLQNAQSSINLSYYIFRDDHICNQIMKILREKAAAGLEVRLIYDFIGSMHTPKRIFRDLRKAGGEINVLFPFFFANFRSNYRNHRKIVVIDGSIGYLGGMNIGDEYAGKGNLRPWRDTHLRIVGSAVYMLQARFLMDWAYLSKSVPPLSEKYFPSIQPENKGAVGMQIVSSGPDNDTEQIKIDFIKMILSSQKTLYIQTPYFIPDDSILDALKIAVLSGVDVSIMLPRIYDRLIVYCASNSYISPLMELGVKFYLYDGFLHSKMIIMDDKITSIGSCNMDIRSFSLDFEVNAFIYDSKFSAHCQDIFLEDTKNAHLITPESHSQRPLLVRTFEPIFRLFSPLF